MIYHLVGQPIPLQRPRFTKRGITYDAQALEKEDCRIQLKLQHGAKPKLTGPLHIEITFFMQVPRSFSKKNRSELLKQPHIKKPDLDNLIKWVLDCAMNIIYSDDSIVYYVTACKIYDTIPRTEITITEVENESTQKKDPEINKD